jgi:hypothetical protein
LNARVMKSAVRFTVTWLAAWCQIIAVAAMPLGPLAAGLDPLAEVPICHADADGGQPRPSAPIRGRHDCAQCVLCVSHALPLALLSPLPALPDRRADLIVRLEAAQPRGPPVRLVAAAQPRGPPSLI